jgi:hypothetical protein
MINSYCITTVLSCACTHTVLPLSMAESAVCGMIACLCHACAARPLTLLHLRSSSSKLTTTGQ